MFSFATGDGIRTSPPKPKTSPSTPAGRCRLVPPMRQRIDGETFSSLFSTLLIISFHHNLRRSHALGCNPCSHEDVFDDDLWILWDDGMDAFSLRMLYEINMIVDLSPARVKPNIFVRMGALLYFSYLKSITQHPIAVWIRSGLLPLIIEDPPTELDLFEVDEKLYEFGRDKPDLAPFPKHAGTNLIRTVVYGFGLLGWVGYGQGCSTKAIFRNENGLGAAETTDPGKTKSCLFTPESFFKVLIEQLEVRMPPTPPEEAPKISSTLTMVIDQLEVKVPANTSEEEPKRPKTTTLAIRAASDQYLSC
ncbi:hypothetical protein BGZ63DRAFT_149751 [Mariannaea sp. PMI_226]|nr:hypothetical protein BGZ63DRAFT_149751 [Mariannaea sp. PMI_226]